MIRIFVTGLRGIPDVMGGVESHCEALYPRLQRLSSAVEITVVGRVPYVDAAKTRVAGLTVKGVPAVRSTSLEAISSTLLAVLYARLRRADIVHIHAIGPALTTGIARMLGLKVVVTHHGKDYARGKWGRLAKAMLKRGERAAMRHAHRVICVSPSLREELVSAFPEAAGRTVYIPNGVPGAAVAGDTARAEADRVLAAHGARDGEFVLAVGRLVPEKGFDTLIDAANRMASPPKLLIVGGSEHRSSYAERLTRKAGPQVRFAGMLPREVVFELQRRTALFVMPSFHEGLPIAALEAADAGAPLLLSDIAANRDLGLAPVNYFPVGDVDALVAALAQPPRCYAVDADAVRDRFDWNRIAAETLRVYEAFVP
ncbi:glycosyltransferase family 4 protein [Stakelama saccharophila]|uniref:Glycosyltransferase family 4 protein n=1 Tax=Stakelama saccharophila TaxID=3075605 RepID=A0ABZ0BB57_9SPHN|nr:glycosyltransferase family 4 protein [Stakelama sp. W311]WNO54513.1 glycosyltransferase family 4 protein [Stakelama sp. W311]